MAENAKPSLKIRVGREMRSLAITALYLWVLLSVFALHRDIILSRYHIVDPLKFGFAAINALILAKFMWLGEILKAGKKAEAKALWFSVLWNSAMFSLILMACHLIEETLVKVWHGGALGASFAEAVSNPRDILATLLLMLVVLMPFFFAKGLIQILGKDEMKRLVFQAR
jgi:hypothetical protein